MQMKSLQEEIIDMLVEKLPEYMHDAEEKDGSRDCVVNFSHPRPIWNPF